MSSADQPDTSQPASSGVSRREFVTTGAAAGAAFMIVPRHVLGRGFQAPSDLVNVACIGINGQGSVNTRAVMSQNIVAICDVDLDLLDGKLAQWTKQAQAGGEQQRTTGQGGGGARRARPDGGQAPAGWKYWPTSNAQLAANERWPAEDQSATLQKFVQQDLPRLKKYQDYREMLEKQKDIDAVIVATPDHMHAVQASNTMDAGKHVYVQKPLCWSVHEARHLTKKAAEKKIVGQMGNQRHSEDGNRRAVEYIIGGAIGEVNEVHVWTNRPYGFWPQGVPRPRRSTELTNDGNGGQQQQQLRWDNRGIMQRLAAAMYGDYKVPDRLAWDLFLGVAPEVEYHPIYHPFNWRGWVDWGVGALGDMGAHLIDFPLWALNLGLPTVIETEFTPFNGVSYPHATTTFYEFPKRKGFPELKMKWYDGGLLPTDPEELGATETLSPGGGVLYIGKKGKLLQDNNGTRLLPVSRHNSYGPPRERLPRVPHEDHEMNWINAIKGKEQLSSPMDYAALLTEIMLLGIVSLRANSKLYYDAANMRVTNNADASQYLTREYRMGYSL
jgi:predicted dehydrogenase